MTYAAVANPYAQSLGQTECTDCYENYLGLWQDSDDVYVFRMHLTGIAPPIETAAQALKFVKAFGQVHRQKDMDVNGVAVEDKGNGNYTIEVVYTTTDSGPTGCRFGVCWTEGTLAEKIIEQPELKAEWPSIGVTGGYRRELVKPLAAVDFWRSSPVLWSHVFESAGGFGGPTQSYGSQQGAWTGSASHRQARFVPPDIPPVGPVVPPPPGPPVVPPGPNGPPVVPPEKAGMTNEQLGMIAIGLVGAYLIFGRKKGKSRA